jgi:hypothetical protein
LSIDPWSTQSYYRCGHPLRAASLITTIRLIRVQCCIPKRCRLCLARIDVDGGRGSQCAHGEVRIFEPMPRSLHPTITSAKKNHRAAQKVICKCQPSQILSLAMMMIFGKDCCTKLQRMSAVRSQGKDEESHSHGGFLRLSREVERACMGC